jgi:serine/threonine-protein kinase
MTDVSERWKRLEALFDEALALDEAQRPDWLAALDVDDDTRRELAGMLAADRATPAEGLTSRFGAAIASAAEVPVPGERIGPYRLLREIGSGGVGVVFLAERADDQFHQEVAIKVIRGIATGDAVRQLRHERQILAGFDHPNIARLLDGGATPGGHPYLAMEFIRGAPITDACEKRNVPLKTRIALLAEIARAVHYAHQRLVIHRHQLEDRGRRGFRRGREV